MRPCQRAMGMGHAFAGEQARREVGSCASRAAKPQQGARAVRPRVKCKAGGPKRCAPVNQAGCQYRAEPGELGPLGRCASRRAARHSRPHAQGAAPARGCSAWWAAAALAGVSRPPAPGRVRGCRRVCCRPAAAAVARTRALPGADTVTGL
jgi:hypothetical protein